jgi:hypothetical protein
VDLPLAALADRRVRREFKSWRDKNRFRVDGLGTHPCNIHGPQHSLRDVGPFSTPTISAATFNWPKLRCSSSNSEQNFKMTCKTRPHQRSVDAARSLVGAPGLEPGMLIFAIVPSAAVCVIRVVSNKAMDRAIRRIWFAI